MSDRSGRALLAFFVAAAAAAAGLASLAYGIACFAEGDGDAGCAVLTVVVPLTTLPFALGAGILGAAWHGWLTSDPEEGAGGADEALVQSGDPPRG